MDFSFHPHKREIYEDKAKMESDQGSVDMVIGKKYPTFIDMNDILHAIRGDSPIWIKHRDLLKQVEQHWSFLVQTLMCCGVADCSRAPIARRLSLGAGAFCYGSNNCPDPHTGFKPLDKYFKDNPVGRQLFLSVIGDLTKMVWACSQGMQIAAGMPLLGGDLIRDSAYAKQLRHDLQIESGDWSHSQFSMVPQFKKVTPSAELISEFPHHHLHKDLANPVPTGDIGFDTCKYQYSKSAAFSVTLANTEDPSKKYLFQLLCYFRNSISCESQRISSSNQLLAKSATCQLVEVQRHLTWNFH
ncbi:unnamed protein product [Cylindrotheca closterium]|uniref:Uncharacterized protein n=1 Tax=Cylindrotheca closterium TaxID=2856 RepID=A0AAD2CKX7_9STRA|nr:unnamed protein product [Cylindrotheca closterium]